MMTFRPLAVLRVFVLINFPALIRAERVRNCSGVVSIAHADVVLVAVVAEVLEEALEIRYPHHSATAEALERIGSDFTFTHMGPHASVQIVG
jgi:orotate phosphoribosyltransferase-like protein